LSLTIVENDVLTSAKAISSAAAISSCQTL
jgi:hypothetical protein